MLSPRFGSEPNLPPRALRGDESYWLLLTGCVGGGAAGGGAAAAAARVARGVGAGAVVAGAG